MLKLKLYRNGTPTPEVIACRDAAHCGEELLRIDTAEPVDDWTVTLASGDYAGYQCERQIARTARYFGRYGR